MIDKAGHGVFARIFIASTGIAMVACSFLIILLTVWAAVTGKQLARFYSMTFSIGLLLVWMAVGVSLVMIATLKRGPWTSTLGS